MSNLTNIILIATVLTSGCTTIEPESVVSPSEITIENALEAIGRGIVELKSELNKENIKTGLLVDEVQLTLALTSKASDSKTLAIDISKTLASGKAGIGGKAFGLTSVEAAEGSRGSTLIIKLKNAALVEIKNKEERNTQTLLNNNLELNDPLELPPGDKTRKKK